MSSIISSTSGWRTPASLPSASVSRLTPAVQRYHVEPDGQADGQSLWLLHFPLDYYLMLDGHNCYCSLLGIRVSLKQRNTHNNNIPHSNLKNSSSLCWLVHLVANTSTLLVLQRHPPHLLLRRRILCQVENESESKTSKTTTTTTTTTTTVPR